MSCAHGSWDWQAVLSALCLGRPMFLLLLPPSFTLSHTLSFPFCCSPCSKCACGTTSGSRACSTAPSSSRAWVQGRVEREQVLVEVGVPLDASTVRFCLSGEARLGRGSKAPHVITIDEYLAQQGTDCLKHQPLPRLHPQSLPHFDAKHQIPGTCAFQGPTEVLDSSGWLVHTVTKAELQFLRKLEDPVVTLGSLFTEKVEGHNVRGPLAPFNLHPSCKDLWNPHPTVLSLVDQVTASFTAGEAYAAMHLRRYGTVHFPGRTRGYPWCTPARPWHTPGAPRPSPLPLRRCGTPAAHRQHWQHTPMLNRGTVHCPIVFVRQVCPCPAL